MVRMHRTTALILASVALPICALAADPPSFRRGAGLDTLFKSFDKNGDGKVTKEEAGDAPWFDRIDLNHNGEITREELTTVAKIFAR